MNWKEIEHQMYTMCMVADGDQILLIKRPDYKGFPGYLAPGAKSRVSREHYGRSKTRSA